MKVLLNFCPGPQWMAAVTQELHPGSCLLPRSMLDLCGSYTCTALTQPNPFLPAWVSSLTSDLPHCWGLGGSLGCLETTIPTTHAWLLVPRRWGLSLQQRGHCRCPWLPAHRPSRSSLLLLRPGNFAICHGMLRWRLTIWADFSFSISILLFVAFQFLASFHLVYHF